MVVIGTIAGPVTFAVLPVAVLPLAVLPVALAVTIPVTVPVALALRRLLALLPLCLALAVTVALGITFRPRFAFPLHLLVALGLPLAVELLLLLARAVNLALRLGKHARVMLGMLGKVLGPHPVAGQLRVAMQLGVFLDDLRGVPRTLPSGPELSNTRLMILPPVGRRLRFLLPRDRDFDDLMWLFDGSPAGRCDLAFSHSRRHRRPTRLCDDLATVAGEVPLIPNDATV